jgi:hypothetical protein
MGRECPAVGFQFCSAFGGSVASSQLSEAALPADVVCRLSVASCQLPVASCLPSSSGMGSWEPTVGAQGEGRRSRRARSTGPGRRAETSPGSRIGIAGRWRSRRVLYPCRVALHMEIDGRARTLTMVF